MTATSQLTSDAPLQNVEDIQQNIRDLEYKLAQLREIEQSPDLYRAEETRNLELRKKALEDEINALQKRTPRLFKGRHMQKIDDLRIDMRYLDTKLADIANDRAIFVNVLPAEMERTSRELENARRGLAELDPEHPYMEPAEPARAAVEAPEQYVESSEPTLKSNGWHEEEAEAAVESDTQPVQSNERPVESSEQRGEPNGQYREPNGRSAEPTPGPAEPAESRVRKTFYRAAMKPVLCDLMEARLRFMDAQKAAASRLDQMKSERLDDEDQQKSRILYDYVVGLLCAEWFSGDPEPLVTDLRDRARDWKGSEESDDAIFELALANGLMITPLQVASRLEQSLVPGDRDHRVREIERLCPGALDTCERKFNHVMRIADAMWLRTLAQKGLDRLNQITS